MAEIDVGKDVPASNGTTTAPDASDVLSALGSIAPADTTPADTTPAEGSRAGFVDHVAQFGPSDAGAAV
jgi:hypothetical protein